MNVLHTRWRALVLSLLLAASLAGFSVGEAPVIMKERQGGVSSIHSFKSAYYMIKVSLALIIDRFSIHKVKGGKA